MPAGYSSTGSIEVSDPNLRAAFFRRHECKALTVRCPAGTVGILVADDLARLAASDGHDPDVRRFRVGIEADINGAEHHPLAIRRGDRLVHTFERHHVFKGEGMFALRGCQRTDQ